MTGSVYVVGCGSVGTALALRLQRVGVTVTGGHCRTEAGAGRASAALGWEVSWGEAPPAGALSAAAVLIVAVPDPVIRQVAQRLSVAGELRSEQVVLHCSGARNAVELEPVAEVVAGVGSFHPLLSFAVPEAASELLGEAAFAIEGDGAAVEAARGLAAALGGRVLEVEASDRGLYHAAAATASNHLVALVAQAAAVLEGMGIERSEGTAALLPLMRSTLANLERLGLPGALTGPVSRGDARCVREHLAALSASAPAELTPYRVMARRALEVAREQAAAPPEGLAEVEGALGGAEDESS